MTTTTMAPPPPPCIHQHEQVRDPTSITAAASPFAKYLTRQVVQEWEALEQAFPPTANTKGATYDWHHLEVQSVLGQGGFGIVLECSCNNHTNNVVAVKCVKAKTIHNDLDMMAAASDLYLEGQWLTMLQGHEHIVELQGVSREGLSTAYTQENSDNGYFLVLPVLGETLAQRLLSSSSSPGKTDVRQALSTMVLPLASALVHVHDHNLVYRDLKPGNIAFSKDNDTLKLLDFGLCRPLSSMVGVGQVAGSVPYMAPEMLLGQSTHLASDVYSFGILAHFILTGMAPLRHQLSLHDAQQDELQRRSQRQSRFPKASSKLLPKNLAKLLQACVQDDPLDRPTMQQVLQELQAILLQEQEPKKKKKTLWKQLSRKLSSSLSTNTNTPSHPLSSETSVDGWTASGSSSASSTSAVRHKTATTTSSSLIDQWFTISVVPPNE